MSSPAMCCDKPFSSHCVSRYVCGLMADRVFSVASHRAIAFFSLLFAAFLQCRLRGSLSVR